MAGGIRALGRLLQAATKRTAKSRAAAARKAMDRVVAILAGAVLTEAK
jgi:hypothetical protein